MASKILRLREETLKRQEGLKVMLLFSVKILKRFISIVDFAKRNVILPCDNSNDLESLTTDVQRKLRSLDAVSNCFPSSP